MYAVCCWYFYRRKEGEDEDVDMCESNLDGLSSSDLSTPCHVPHAFHIAGVGTKHLAVMITCLVVLYFFFGSAVIIFFTVAAFLAVCFVAKSSPTVTASAAPNEASKRVPNMNADGQDQSLNRAISVSEADDVAGDDVQAPSFGVWESSVLSIMCSTPSLCLFSCFCPEFVLARVQSTVRLSVWPGAQWTTVLLLYSFVFFASHALILTKFEVEEDNFDLLYDNNNLGTGRARIVHIMQFFSAVTFGIMMLRYYLISRVRQAFRSRFRLRGTLCGDFCCTMFCQSCILGQMDQQMRTHAKLHERRTWLTYFLPPKLCRQQTPDYELMVDEDEL